MLASWTGRRGSKNVRVGFEQPVDQVFPDGKYGPTTPVGGDTSTADIRCVPLLPNKLWDLPTKDAHIPVSVDVVDGYIVPDVYQGKKPQAVIERSRMHLLPGTKSSIMKPLCNQISVLHRYFCVSHI